MRNPSIINAIQFFLFVGGPFISAWMAQTLTKSVAGFKPSYWAALIATVLACVTSISFSMIVKFVVMLNGAQVTPLTHLFDGMVGLLVLACCYTAFFKNPDNCHLGFGRACAIAIVQLVVYAMVISGIVFGLIAMGFFHNSNLPSLPSWVR
jgi:hypothetical protein